MARAPASGRLPPSRLNTLAFVAHQPTEPSARANASITGRKMAGCSSGPPKAAGSHRRNSRRRGAFPPAQGATRSRGRSHRAPPGCRASGRPQPAAISHRRHAIPILSGAPTPRSGRRIVQAVDRGERSARSLPGNARRSASMQAMKYCIAQSAPTDAPGPGGRKIAAISRDPRLPSSTPRRHACCIAAVSIAEWGALACRQP